MLMENVVVKEPPMLRVCPQCGINLAGQCLQCPQCGMDVMYVKSYPLSQAGYEQMMRENAQILQQSRAGGAQAGGGYAQAQPGAAGSVQPAAGGTAPEGAAVQAKFCHQCGAKLAPGAKFCSACGTKLA